ncbi:hypothetical protein M427DRAFT_464335 [Gonapodya prolifera JEL478]|uniref:Xylanolytic transcriptional activator regulatory domain-containing protein n=1 Tax=Gonapodya prolifera (strain JEL478) TaxID=1344416 RepID=A0A139A1Q8_GONPJ|nr:hypothetical protein M427DRAFT_464335 [Gonapodya prolifera JEL478]|eukprot:KXS10716.1 hypothetical protein M427DRAFT_464335 [Gonapodya prolifera JEL478]
MLTLAMMLAKDMKLNYEPDEELGLTWVEKEQRRRVFWNLYMMDRHLAAMENRDLLISDREVHLNLPCLDAVYEADDPMMAPPTTVPAPTAFATLDDPDQLRALVTSGSIGPSALQIMIFRMFGSVIRFHHTANPTSAEKERIDRQLDAFYDNLPPNIRALDNVDRSNDVRNAGAKPDRRISTGLMLWHTLKILLHGPWDVNSMCADSVWLSSSDFLICAEHSELIVRKVENYLTRRAEPHRPYIPSFVIFCFLMSSMVHITLIRKLRGSGGQIEREVIHKIAVYAKAFQALRSRWRLAQYMQLVIERELVQSGLRGLDATVESLPSDAAPKVEEIRWEVGGLGVMALAEAATRLEKLSQQEKNSPVADSFVSTGSPPDLKTAATPTIHASPNTLDSISSQSQSVFQVPQTDNAFDLVTGDVRFGDLIDETAVLRFMSGGLGVGDLDSAMWRF